MSSFSSQDITIGRIVIYRSKTGQYSMPAVVSATRDTLYLPNVSAGHLADLSAADNVHLVVFTAGASGHRSAGTDPSLGAANPPAGGSFAEYDIAYSDDPEAPGCWSWPRRG